MAAADSWLLLIHQLPPKPPYLRVKVWRRLQALGAVPSRTPSTSSRTPTRAREDFEWVLREIQKDGATPRSARRGSIEGLTDDEVRGLFLRAREEDYRALATDIRKFAHEYAVHRARARSPTRCAPQSKRRSARFRKRLAETREDRLLRSSGARGRRGAHRVAWNSASPTRGTTEPTRRLERREDRRGRRSAPG